MKKEFKSPISRVLDVQAANLMAASGQAITGAGTTASFGGAQGGATSGGRTDEYAESKGFTGGFFWE